MSSEAHNGNDRGVPTVADITPADTSAPALAEPPVNISPTAPATPASAGCPENLYVVSDNFGFVGAFSSAAFAEELVLRKYPSIPFITQRFPTIPGPCDSVWVVLYRDIDAVAFVSNSRSEAERVQGVYQRVGLSYPDSIDHWEQALNVVSKPAEDRLIPRHRAHLMYAGPLTTEEVEKMEAADLARVEALVASKDDGPLARVIRELEPVTIMDCVIPSPLESTAAASPAALSQETVAVAVGEGITSPSEPLAAAVLQVLQVENATPSGETTTLGAAGESTPPQIQPEGVPASSECGSTATSVEEALKGAAAAEEAIEKVVTAVECALEDAENALESVVAVDACVSTRAEIEHDCSATEDGSGY